MEFVELIKTPKVEGVVLERPCAAPLEGTLCLTGHHLIVSSRREHAEEMWLRLSSIDAVEKRFAGTVGTLTIKCKDLRIILLHIPGMEECHNIASSIEVLSTLTAVNLYYPFFYRPMFEALEDGWHSFLPEHEFTRLTSHTADWRLSHVNKDFTVCPSYPPVVIIPKAIDDEMVKKVSAFRQNGRFPVLSYYHKTNGMVMMRCSQPLTGSGGKRCKDDEKLVNAVLGPGKRGYIIDTRSLHIAQQARAKGGGYEPEAHYPQWRRINKSIERYNLMQDSFIKLVEACNDPSHNMDRWLSKLEASNWLGHIKDILTAACLAAQCLDREGASVLVHGSDGTDSTLQVSALAQVILDQDCRTLRGFQALVEREWLQAGHPFQERCSRSAFANVKPRQEAPSFLLFLDCCQQIQRQFPCSFEFGERFLVLLFEHAYASQFGTFLCNSELERMKMKVQQKTVSMWSWVNRPEVMEQYLNPLYEPNNLAIWPSVAPQSLVLWEGVFLRWNQSFKCVQEAWDEVVLIAARHKELQARVSSLKDELASLETARDPPNGEQ
ncbi:myotubularin-related protein 9 isoform X2 [Petromyzon marinus]|uniref:Myotubularin-related protein 9 isoform X2 n=1 Tax=Petromyzon marinus TaxID=7757 RepID=A0AAJ7T1J6_PETMA|nr:myotubularin-related protein 9 isoform X2 [Petromyzon marinus]